MIDGKPTSFELFAGAGGLALGVQLAGFTSLGTVEWNKWACETMRLNKSLGYPLVADGPSTKRTFGASTGLRFRRMWICWSAVLPASHSR